MNFINYLLFALFFPFVYGSENSLSSRFNLGLPHVRYNHSTQMLYLGENNYSMPIPAGFEDARWVGGNNNVSVIRIFEDGAYSFVLMQGLCERNMILTPDTALLNDNENTIIGGWGIYPRSNKILVAWIEYSIVAKGQDIKKKRPNDLLGIVGENPKDFDITAWLRIFDLVPKNLGSPALSPRGPLSILIENFPFDSRVRSVPVNILFSPDGEHAIVPVESGFVLCPLLTIFPPLPTHVFFFGQTSNQTSEEISDCDPANNSSDNSENFDKIGQFFAFKWVTVNRFLVLAYTSCVTKFLQYSKGNGAWYSDEISIDEINEKIKSFEKLLVHLRFHRQNENSKKISIFGIFLGLPSEQLLGKIKIQ